MTVASQLCECECGEPVAIYRGSPRRFVAGHSQRRKNPGHTVDQLTGCWNWNGYVHSNGYPSGVSLNGRVESAHRAAYIKAKGEIPTGMQVDHQCDNSRCVNPEHLNLLTPAGNTRRKAATRLTERHAESIRSMAADGISTKVLAEQFGVTKRHIRNVVSGRNWS